MNIRIAERTDLPEIVSILNEAISYKKYNAHLSPVTIEERYEWFEDHKSNTYPIYIAEKKRNIVGWCCLSAYRPGREALITTAEISFYVLKEKQGQGIASEMVKRIIKDCKKLEIKNVFAIVLAGNDASIELLKKMGFRKWGFMPRVVVIGGKEIGQYYFGKRIYDK